MSNEKPRKDKVKSSADERNYQSKPRINKPNTASGHSDKVRQTEQGGRNG